MKPIYILIIAAILALAAGVWLVQQPDSNKLQSQLLFKDLSQFANDLHSVEIENAQGVVFSAKKSGDSWLATVAPQLPTYPVSQEQLATLVTSLVQLKLIEPKTSKTKNYARLGLQDISNIDSLASLVRLKTSDHSWSVLVGNNVSFTEGSYVRRPKNQQSWRTNKTITLPLDKFSWLKQPILPFTAEDIVAISRVDKVNWQMVKQDDGNFNLTHSSADSTLKYQGVLEAMAASVSSLNFEKLLVSDEVSYLSQNILAEFELEMAQGDLIRLVVSEMDGNHLVSFPTEFPNEYWHNWHYQVSNFSAQQIVKTPEDFLAQKNPALTAEDLDKSNNVEEGESPN